MNEPYPHHAGRDATRDTTRDATSDLAGDRSVTIAHGWRARLEKLVDPHPITDEEASEPTQLALQFELRELIPRTADRWNGPTSRSVKAGQEPGSGIYRLATRPAHRTARGWARGNLTWSNIGHQGGRHHLDEAQQRWFRQIFALHRAANPITVGQDANWMLLDDFASPALWTMLRQAATLGISLVSAVSNTPVQIHAEAEISLEATAGESGDLALVPVLRVDGEPVSLSGLHGIREAGAVSDHGLYLADHEGDKLVQLAPVSAGVSAAEAALLAEMNSARPIVVPAAERDAFLAEGVPELRAEFTVASSDGSVTLPQPRPATAVLTAAWHRGHKLTLWWSIETAPGVARGVASGTAPSLADFPSDFLPDSVFDNRAMPEEWADFGGDVPPPMELRGADAAEFLHLAVPELQQLPGVEVRITGNAPEYREAEGEPELRVTTIPSEKEDWFDLGVLVTVGGKTVPFAPLFRALAQGKKKLLLVDNTYLYLNHQSLTPLAELIAEGQDLDEWETGLRVSRHQAVHWADFEDLADETEEAVRWRALVRDLRDEHTVPVDVPDGIAAELRPYQLAGYHWLSFLWRNRLGGILADDMGLGKTLQCLTLIEAAKRGGSTEAPEPRPFLVVAPTSVVSNWAAEAAKFAPQLRVRVRSATEAASGRPVARDAAEADLIVTSYALYRLDYERYHDVAVDPARGIAGLILDEAQFVKNPLAQGNELAQKLPVSWKLAVTGTPMENSLRELFALCKVVAPGLFPSARRFEEEYIRTIERPAPGNSVGAGAGSGPEMQAALRSRRLQQLRTKLKPFMLRRTKDLVATELPEKQEQLLEVELDAEHRQLYDAFLQRERQKLYGLIADLDKNRFTVFRSLTLLRMLALDASLIDAQYEQIPSAKLDSLVDNVTELVAERRQALVFSQFTSFLDRARTRLEAAGVRTVTLDGGTRKRDAVIDHFRSGEADVFLISLKAGGVGLNLTEADTVFLLDPWWNPASEAQAIDRTHRIGQHKSVHVLRMVALGTIEEKVVELQRRKRDLFASVIDDEQLFSQTLTAGDIRDLLQ